MGEKLNFEELWTLTGGLAVADNVDVPCPACGPTKSKMGARRKVLRVWHPTDDVMTYKCQRCTISGWTKRYGPGEGTTPTIRKSKLEKDRRKQAAMLWDKAKPLEKSLAAVYLKMRKCFLPSPNLRYLPAEWDYPPTMIARFANKDGSTHGVHLTRLSSSGLHKANIETPKITLGPSMGWPIIVADRRNRAELIICEGIEDALSFAVADPHINAWAAGSAGRIAPVLKRARTFNKVFIAVDDDDAGKVALKQAFKLRPDVIPVNLTQLMRSKNPIDANKIMTDYGAVALKRYLDLAEHYMRIERGAA